MCVCVCMYIQYVYMNVYLSVYIYIYIYIYIYLDVNISVYIFMCVYILCMLVNVVLGSQLTSQRYFDNTVILVLKYYSYLILIIPLVKSSIVMNTISIDG